MQNNKNLWIGLVVILVIIGGFLLWSMKNAAVPQGSNTNGAPVETTEDTSAGSVNTGLSYAQAMSKYNGARIAVDANCKANPSSARASGGLVMVDNQSSLDRVIKVGTIIFNLKANSFKVIKLDGQAGTLSVDCDQTIGVGSVSV